MKADPETTLAGVGAIVLFGIVVSISIFDGNPETNPDWETILDGIMIALLGGGLIRAKDSKPNNKAGK